MGSDAHYAEETPAHTVEVDGFWIDRAQVTNRQFEEFVSATGYTTVAERPLDPADFPGAPPENLVPGSMVFTMTAGPVDLRHLSQWWSMDARRVLAPSGGPGQFGRRSWRSSRRARRLRGCRGLRRVGRQGGAQRG